MEEKPIIEQKVIDGLTSFRDSLKEDDWTSCSHVTIVSEAAYNQILDLIENPPDPSPALVEAVKRYKKEIEEGRLIVKD